MSTEGIKSKRSSGGRVRIAEVLAEARASLKEPSRPITPAGLDARIDYMPTSENYGAYKSSTASYLYSNALNRSRGNSMNNSDGATRTKSTKPNVRSDISLLILDIQDTINVLDTELQNIHHDHTGLNQTLFNMTQIIDKFAKYIKSNETDDHQELYLRLLNSLCQILDSTNVKSIRQQTCRHILRLHLIQYPMNVKEKLSPDDARILWRTTRDMYLTSQDIRGPGEGGGGAGGDDGDENEYDPPSSASTSLSSSPAEDVMTGGGINLILEFLSVIWDQLKLSDGLNLFAVNTNQLSCKMFLEAGTHAAGILKSSSYKELNRKRLMHMTTLNIMSDGIKAVIQSYSAYKHHLNSKSSDTLISQSTTDVNVIISQLGKIMVQIIGTIRNFSQDATARQFFLSNHTICHISNLLHLFSNNPELSLNCVRVTHKLTLAEPFRLQLSSKSKYIVPIARIIVQEAELCKRVMNGDTTVVWPTWNTWPLLSRAAFTLGNLTTRNDENRILIADTCGCLKPLIMILQTCSYSLMSLFSGRNLDSDGEDGEDEDYEDDDYDNGGGDEDGYGDEHGEEKKGKEMKKSKSAKSLARKESREYQAEESDGEPQEESVAEYELCDATVKLLRLFANLSINESIGYSLAKRKDSAKMLLELLTCSEIGGDHEELQLNVVAACTNLTFYSCRGTIIPDDDTPMSPRVIQPTLTHDATVDLQSLATRLSNYLFHENNEVVLEAARALGNLTRCDAVIHSLCSTRAVEALVLLLNHADTAILLAVTGALVNVSANVISTTALTDSEKPVVSLSSVLRRSSFKNLQLSTLVCQVLHNLLLHGSDSNEEFESFVAEAVYGPLSELVDCAVEFQNDLTGEDEEEDIYFPFITVGRLVLNFLHKK